MTTYKLSVLNKTRHSFLQYIINKKVIDAKNYKVSFEIKFSKLKFLIYESQEAKASLACTSWQVKKSDILYKINFVIRASFVYFLSR